MAKDIWDKLDIVVGNIILVAIPIVIGVVGETISRSLETGQLIDSLLDDLTTPKAETRRDIALIALDSAIPLPNHESQPDQVVDIAKILLQDTIVGVGKPQEILERKIESSVAKQIIVRRKPSHGQQIIKTMIAESVERLPLEQRLVDIGNKNGEDSTGQDNLKREQTAEIITNLLPDDIKLVYIQYKQDSQIAAAVQDYLKTKNIVTPEIEQISSIQQSDIRFYGESDQQQAQQLKSELENFLNDRYNLNLDFKLIDLSQLGYQVHSGQFELWINN